MRSVGRLESSLSEIVNTVKTVDGVVGIILFGSVARGEADEGSDIDLLVLFEDEDKMRMNEWEVTRRIPPNLFTQSICACASTLKMMNPVFLQSVLEEGLILYAQYPLVLRSRLANAVVCFIVTYSLEELPQREKKRVNYKLFGRRMAERRYLGLVEERGGRHLGRGCFLIPKENAEVVLNVLNEHNVKYESIEVYIPNKAQVGTPAFLQL
ncbi:MAG: Nucleotidyltransferase domain protein [Candidatus Bathyarchaeota archaeon BA2]|nr:MAG: Nucleotidyltransferase domain protein [Candidatus Bathyarchaeota archaeon BA2]